MRKNGVRAARHRFFGPIRLFEVPVDRAFEIDDAEDLALAEALAGPLRQEGARRSLPERIAGLVLDFGAVLTHTRAVTLEILAEPVLTHPSVPLGIQSLPR